MFSPKKIIKLLGLNIGIAVVDIIFLSPGLLGIEIIGGSTFGTALGVTVIIMSVIVFIYGNYKLVIEQEKIIRAKEIKTTEDCIDALNQNYDKRIFQKDIATILEQIEMFQKKREAINDVLLQKFDAKEMSYSKFDGVILDLQEIFYMNIKSIINKLNAFDKKDYDRIKKEDKKFSNEFVQAKLNIYNQYISFVRKGIEDNEHIILKLDKILLELSKFFSIENGKIEDMRAMKEIDDLINKIKLYD